MRIILAGALAPVLLVSTAFAQAAQSAPAHSSSTSSAAGSMAPGDSQQPAPPAHPLTAAQAHQLMTLTGTARIKENLVEEINQYFEQRLPPNVPADVKTDLNSSLEKMDIDTPTVATYQKYLSTEDATKAIAFYETPSGKALLKATPLLLKEVQQTALQTGQTTVKGVLDRHRPEIEAAVKQYQQQHAPPPSLNSPASPGGSAAPQSATPPQK